MIPKPNFRRFAARTLPALAALSMLALSACSDETKPENKAPSEDQVPVAAIDAAAARASGIEVARAGSVSMSSSITLYGSIKTNAERAQSLRARYPGVVRRVNKRVGEHVGIGETILTVESSESLQSYAITSPIAGTVLERNANPGETVGSDTVLIRVADLTSVWAEFAVFARDLGKVRSEQPVRIVSNENGTAIGKISYVAPSGEGGHQSVVARAVIENNHGRWIPGQFVTGEITIDEFHAAVGVARSALQAMNGKDVVFVRTQKGFVARNVTLGRSSRNAVEISSGLQAGEVYATVNSYLVKAELTKGEAEEE